MGDEVDLKIQGTTDEILLLKESLPQIDEEILAQNDILKEFEDKFIIHMELAQQIPNL